MIHEAWIWSGLLLTGVRMLTSLVRIALYEHFTKNDFPIFTVCPYPAFDMEEMNNLGYPDLFSHKTGLDAGLDYPTSSNTIEG